MLKLNVETRLGNQPPPKQVIQCKNTTMLPQNVFSRAWQKNKKITQLNIIFHPFPPPTLLSRFVPFLIGRVTRRRHHAGQILCRLIQGLQLRSVVVNVDIVYLLDPQISIRCKDLQGISHGWRTIANFAPNFVAMAMRVVRGKNRLAAFDGLCPNPPSTIDATISQISFAKNRVITHFGPNFVVMATEVDRSKI